MRPFLPHQPSQKSTIRAVVRVQQSPLVEYQTVIPCLRTDQGENSTPAVRMLSEGSPWHGRCAKRISVALTTRMTTQRGFSLMEIMIVVGLTGVIAAIAVPMVGNNLAYYRLSGDARSNANATGLGKMRAASVFGHERLYVDRTARSYRLETWDKTTSTWIADGGAGVLSQNVPYGFGVVGRAPPTRKRSSTSRRRARTTRAPPTSPIPPASSSTPAACR